MAVIVTNTNTKLVLTPKFVEANILGMIKNIINGFLIQTVT